MEKTLIQFTRAIARTPCPEMVNGLTTADLGKPEYEKALRQHGRYVQVLKDLGLEVVVLPPDGEFPDSTFVEDTALLTPRGAVITRSGAPSRRGETVAIRVTLTAYFENIREIKAPGTVDAGDILQVESHYYIGLSERTNQSGAEQMIRILDEWDYSVSTIPLKNMLHLKSGVTYLGNNLLAVAGELIGRPEFAHFDQINIIAEESYAANCLSINGSILMPAGFPVTGEAFRKTGQPVIEIDLSEFRKIDGGLSCLSLRF
jgi:dimethylargininase